MGEGGEVVDIDSKYVLSPCCDGLSLRQMYSVSLAFHATAASPVLFIRTFFRSNTARHFG
jgi:hypothetical protein